MSNFDPHVASVQVALVDADARQGVLEVAPGTHLDPVGWTASFESETPPKRPTVAVALPAGSVTFYVPTLLHRGRANTRARERLTLGLTVVGTDGVVPSALPYALKVHDRGRWSLLDGTLKENLLL